MTEVTTTSNPVARVFDRYGNLRSKFIATSIEQAEEWANNRMKQLDKYQSAYGPHTAEFVL